MTLLGVCFQGVVLETWRCCDCLSGSCCQAVSAALPGRVSGTSFRCTQDGGENRSLCLASTRMGECPELFYLPNKHLDSEMTLDANRPSHSIPNSAESRTSQGDSAQAALHSLVAGVPLTRSATRPPPTYLALLHSPARPFELLSAYQYTQLDFFMGCPACGSFSPLTLIFDHLANTLASSLLPSVATPALALGTLCSSLPQAPGCLQIPFISRSDMVGPAHWLLAEACGQGIKRITMC